jgi:xylan 1,4-beta-xylosidase
LNTGDVSALASRQGNTFWALVWHHHDDDVPGPPADVELSLAGLPAPIGPVLLEHYRIDRDHSNAFEPWKRMGSPQKPSPDQYTALQRSSDLTLLGSPRWLRPEGGKLTVRLKLPRQAVSLLVLDGNAARPE